MVRRWQKGHSWLVYATELCLALHLGSHLWANGG